MRMFLAYAGSAVSKGTRQRERGSFGGVPRGAVLLMADPVRLFAFTFVNV